ncbi:hypothetical protein CR513_13336, partial [Mucuna pruriens]
MEASQLDKTYSAMPTLSSSNQMLILHTDSCRVDSTEPTSYRVPTLNRMPTPKHIPTPIHPDPSWHQKTNSTYFNSVSKSDTFENKPDIADKPLYKLEHMENNNRTLKDLAMSDVLYQPWCIQ